MPVVDINGLKVSYEAAGVGLPVVFIPGLVGTKEWFCRQLSGLSPKYRTVSYDPRTPGRGGDYSVELLAEDLTRFLDAGRVPTAVICGHSFGGTVAQEFARRYPDRTSALVLLSSFASLPSASEEKILSLLTPREQAGAGLGWLRGLFRGRQVDPDSSECLADLAARVGRATVEARLRLARLFDSTQGLGEIEAPTLVTVGSGENEQMLHAAQVLYEGIPDASLEVIEGGDHFSFFFRHDLVNAAIDDFISARLASFS